MNYGLHQAYDRLAKLGDSLAQANNLLDWEGFRPIEEELYGNKTKKGGHPNIDEDYEQPSLSNLSIINYPYYCLNCQFSV